MRELNQLKNLKDSYAALIRENFEYKAKSCLVCETKGACCQDEHFVNVHITRLEAEAIRRVLADKGALNEVAERCSTVVEKYGLDAPGDSFARTYSCPLFVRTPRQKPARSKGVEMGAGRPQDCRRDAGAADEGCLAHGLAKPLPCISHACYENKEDLPPQFLQDRAALKVEQLNRETYGSEPEWKPLPVWLSESQKVEK
jgi:hypothetical protein